MDKAERVAEEIRAELMRAGLDRHNKDLPSLTSAEKVEAVAAILRREYGDVRREAASLAQGATPYDMSEWHKGYCAGRADATAAIRDAEREKA